MKKGKIRFANLFITIFLIYAIITLVHQQINISKLKGNMEASRQKVENISAENQRLEKAIKNANSNAYIEKMAREQLGLVKAGEKVYIIQHANGTTGEGGSN